MWSMWSDPLAAPSCLTALARRESGDCVRGAQRLDLGGRKAAARVAEVELCEQMLPRE